MKKRLFILLSFLLLEGEIQEDLDQDPKEGDASGPLLGVPEATVAIEITVQEEKDKLFMMKSVSLCNTSMYQRIKFCN